MSAIAAVQTPMKTYLYSDGRGIYPHDGRKVDNQKKINKITDQIALFSVGTLKEGISEKIIRQLKSKGSKKPLELAEIISMMLNNYMSDVSYKSIDHPSGEANTIFLLIGYNSDGLPFRYQIDHKNDFVPQEIPSKGVKDITSMIYGVFEEGDNPYISHLRELLKRHEMPIASYQAFVNMIDDYIDTGRVNKNIYSETIAPKLSSPKRCDTLQDIYSKYKLVTGFSQISKAPASMVNGHSTGYVNSSATPPWEACESEERFYNWYVISRRTPFQYQIDLEAVEKNIFQYQHN